MKVPYWSVGATARTDLPITLDEISEHLLADWMPGRPAGLASTVFGWPQVLLRNTSDDQKPHDGSWFIERDLGGTERQWKSMMSWMLGVAGTRHVLSSEGYRWIAPLSAFYPNRMHDVATPRWHSVYSPRWVTADKAPKSGSNLRPDYLAIRPQNKKLEWAVAESKGTDKSLTNLTKCPNNWAAQVRNVVVKVSWQPAPLPIARHLVVATRINPNAASRRGRAVQVRAWNSSDPMAEQLPDAALVEVVGAHLFGVFKNLNMEHTAQGIADGVASYTPPHPRPERGPRRHQQDDYRGAALDELGEFEASRTASGNIRRRIDTALGGVDMEASPVVTELARAFIRAEREEPLAEAIRVADARLDAWEDRERIRIRSRDGHAVSAGFVVRLPEARFRVR